MERNVRQEGLASSYLSMTFENCREQKASIRRQIKQLRKAISAAEKEEWDHALCGSFIQALETAMEDLPQLQDGFVYLYLDIGKEAGTRQIINQLWRRNIRTAVPKVVGRELNFYEISKWDHVTLGYMGIMEPDETAGLPLAKQRDAIVAVPGIAFDRDGFRLGYGGGFYDRFFSREPEHPRWGLAYPFQLIGSVPHEEWDQKVNGLVTPKEAFIIK